MIDKPSNSLKDIRKISFEYAQKNYNEFKDNGLGWNLQHSFYEGYNEAQEEISSLKKEIEILKQVGRSVLTANQVLQQQLKAEQEQNKRLMEQLREMEVNLVRNFSKVWCSECNGEDEATICKWCYQNARDKR